MPKLVCVKCQTELKPETNGTLVVETASFGPYKVWNADTLKCPGCGVEIVADFPDYPQREDHYTHDFPIWLEEELRNARRVVYDNERPTIPELKEGCCCECGARIEIPHAANCPNRLIPLPRTERPTDG